jgi:stage V sporulation protein G
MERGKFMVITDVRIRQVTSESRLRAVASITIDECFAVHELRIIEGKEGLFVAMPSRQVTDGTFKDIAHPINVETRKMIEDAVIAKYKEEC